VFYFVGKHYQQQKGTTIGTKVALTYGTLVLGYFEEILYERIDSKHGRFFQNIFKIIFEDSGTTILLHGHLISVS